MSIRDDNLYISGIVSMASFNMGPSYMMVDCYHDVDSLLKDYKINDNVVFDDVCIPFKELMHNLLRLDDKALDTFLFLISMKAGSVKNIRTICDSKVLDLIEKYTTFYILEEVYFVEFEKMNICFLIGNNE